MIDFDTAASTLAELHARIVTGFERSDGRGKFIVDDWQRPASATELSGSGRTRVMEGGALFERAGVGYSNVAGAKLPPTATARRPELTGASFRACGVSVVCHPTNPFIPTSHMNVRLLEAQAPDGRSYTWFGGGFDLTPYYPFDEDIVAWHQAAHDLCQPFGDAVYATLKAACDDYFYLKHRKETRGVGGLFADDLDESTPVIGMPLERCWELIQGIGQVYLDAYRALIDKRRATPFSDRHREFQAYRRGRYVEFNLVFDRGTHFGLQSGGRTESILMSMPPAAAWRYGYTPAPGSEEAKLAAYLTPRAWLGSPA